MFEKSRNCARKLQFSILFEIIFEMNNSRHSYENILQILTMGNTAARQRLKFKDFAYIAKNTNFASRGVSREDQRR